MSNYLETVSIELNKAYSYFEDIDSYIDKVETILNSGLLTQLEKENNINNALKLINKQKNSFKLEAERLFFTRILLDIFYQIKNSSDLPIYDKLITRLDVEFNSNINELMIVNIDTSMSRYGDSFSNGLIWEIEKVFKPKDESKILEESTKIDTKNTSPIIWESDSVLLFFLINWLKENKFISAKNSRDKIILEHFKDSNGDDFKFISQSLKAMRESFTGKPLKYNKIKKLLEALTEAQEDSEK